jgi:hypothetical protein
MWKRSAIMMMGLLVLAACGEKKPAGGGTTASVEDATAAELARFQAEENARSRVTLIDAASGDAAAMPADWSGPTAFDLRPAEGDKPSPHKEEAKAATKPDETPPPAQEAFPSVAE